MFYAMDTSHCITQFFALSSIWTFLSDFFFSFQNCLCLFNMQDKPNFIFSFVSFLDFNLTCPPPPGCKLGIPTWAHHKWNALFFLKVTHLPSVSEVLLFPFVLNIIIRPSESYCAFLSACTYCLSQSWVLCLSLGSQCLLSWSAQPNWQVNIHAEHYNPAGRRPMCCGPTLCFSGRSHEAVIAMILPLS